MPPSYEYASRPRGRAEGRLAGVVPMPPGAVAELKPSRVTALAADAPLAHDQCRLRPRRGRARVLCTIDEAGRAKPPFSGLLTSRSMHRDAIHRAPVVGLAADRASIRHIDTAFGTTRG